MKRFKSYCDKSEQKGSGNSVKVGMSKVWQYPFNAGMVTCEMLNINAISCTCATS